MPRSVDSIVTFVVWTIAGAVTVAAWISPLYDNIALPCCHIDAVNCQHRSALGWSRNRERTKLGVLSQDVSESVDGQVTEEGAQNIPYVIARGDGSLGGGGLPMPQSYSSSRHEDDEDDHDVEELRRPKVNAEMPKG